MSSHTSPTLTTQSHLLRASNRFKTAKKELIGSVLEASTELRKAGVKPGLASSEAREAYAGLIRDFVRDRGRDLYFPYLASGLGGGPLVELMDGSVKFDMITGIGINFFGHNHPELMDEVIEGLPSDIMQGNLEPGVEMKDAISAVMSRVTGKSHLRHGWLMCSGTMVNEIALKMIRQKKSPATKVMAFKDCFAGRSTAMQEITDNPGYRQGQPIYGEAYYLSFYDPKVGLTGSVENTLREMKEHLTRFPGKFCSLMIELIQGEGGFQYAPREFYVRVFEAAKKAGLAIWVDEIQSFGRTGELFAFQKFQLDEFVDVVTIGKMLQACMVLYTEEYNPRPGLVAGTFSGSSVALRSAKRVIEILCNQGFLGKEGRIEKLSSRFVKNLEGLSKGPCKEMIHEIRAIGGMIAFAPFGGTMDDVKAVLMRLFDLGVVAFYCGHGPYLIRMLPPLGAMTEDEVDQVCSLIGTAMQDVAKKR